jgi:hypothetical protein
VRRPGRSSCIPDGQDRPLTAIEVEQGQRRPGRSVLTVRPGRSVDRHVAASCHAWVLLPALRDSRGLGRDRDPAPAATRPAQQRRHRRNAKPTPGRPPDVPTGPRRAGRRLAGARQAMCRNVACSSCAPVVRARSAASTAPATTGLAAGKRGRTVVLDSDLRRADRAPAPREGIAAARSRADRTAATDSAPGTRHGRINAWVNS